MRQSKPGVFLVGGPEDRRACGGGPLAGLAACVLTLVLTGCSSSNNRAIIRSFENITSGKHHEGGAFAQTHAASVNGLLPFEEVGETYFFTGRRSVLTAIGVSAVTNAARHCPCDPETITYKVIREYPSDATLADLTAIRSNITALSASYIQALRAKSAQTEARTAARDAEAADRASALATSERAGVLYSNAQARAEAQLVGVIDAISKRNVLLFQWDTETQNSFGAKLGDLFSTKRTASRGQHGFGLAAGLKTSHLHIGEDLIRQLAEDVGYYTPALRGKIVLPTFTVAASNLLYFSQTDLTKEIEAHLEASYSELQSGAAFVKSIDKLELDYLSKQFQKLSNIGVIQGPDRVSVQPIAMAHGLADYQRAFAEGSRWSTFYSVLSSVRDIKKVYAPQPRRPCPTCEGHAR